MSGHAARHGRVSSNGQDPELQKLITVIPAAGDKKKNLNSQEHSHRHQEEPKQAGQHQEGQHKGTGCPTRQTEMESRNLGTDVIPGSRSVAAGP